MPRTQLWRTALHALQINCNSFLQNYLEELKQSNWNARHYRLTSVRNARHYRLTSVRDYGT